MPPTPTRAVLSIVCSLCDEHFAAALDRVVVTEGDADIVTRELATLVRVRLRDHRQAAHEEVARAG
jgi:hypothetical protein